MSLVLKGKVLKVMDEVTGTSTTKSWKKVEFLVETIDEQFPKTICFTLFNDRVKLVESLEEGKMVEVYFNLESREYNGKYYHNVNAWRINEVDNSVPEFNPNDFNQPKAAEPVVTTDQNPDLPF